ncbi:MAG TPA: hypothetical protein VJ732_10875, partial [Bryobacteraceae bacterium]|nr:hypothetical protein [Bryobacteraceae bacterium]
MPLTVLSILFGAAFTILAAYGAGVLLLRRLPAPPEIALGLGAAALSFLVFVLLSVHALHPAVLLAVGAALSACALRLRRTPLEEPSKAPLGRAWIAAGLILAVYGAWYVVNAMAPEITPDGITYHLGLPYEYVRRGAFPPRVAFYDMVPQGLEMLYTLAFAFGRHSAAKLVEFTFFLAALPLIFRIGRRLHMADLA